MGFATTLRETRMAKGLSLKRLSDMSGVPLTTIAHYENGTSPTLEKADAILRALGLNMILGIKETEGVTP